MAKSLKLSMVRYLNKRKSALLVKRMYNQKYPNALEIIRLNSHLDCIRDVLKGLQ